MNIIKFHSLIEKQGGLYSALCLELNVASMGATLEEASKNLREAVELYIEDVIEAGDEAEFIPRPAPVEEWMKYFKIELEDYITKINSEKTQFIFDIDQVVYE